MTEIFKDYSKYYDLLYSDKDYKSEVNYLDRLINYYSKIPVRSILNLGCGTGIHDLHLAKKGYKIIGVDLSAQMLVAGEKKKIKNVEFIKDDIRNVRLNDTFDVALSLFHVINYQTSDKDLQDTFRTANIHLKPGGIFIFDFWYGPAVLSEGPAIRKKEMENTEFKICRTSNPLLYPDENMVDVRFEIDITDKLSNHEFHLTESHKMRYLFLPELTELLAGQGFEILHDEEWMTGNPLDETCWNACMIAVKV